MSTYSGDDWNSNATMEEFDGTPRSSTHLSPPQPVITPPLQSPPGEWAEFPASSHRTSVGSVQRQPQQSRPMSAVGGGADTGLTSRTASSPLSPHDGFADGPISQGPREYPDVFTVDLEDDVPSVRGDFATPEDAIQTMIALASLPLSSVTDVMNVPMPTLLARLSAEPRAKEMAEYRDPPLPPHPSSTLLLVKKRLHDEYRLAKMKQRERYLEEEDRIRGLHERQRNALLEAHREALRGLASQEAKYAPPMPVPTARSIQVLEKQLVEGKNETVDAGTRRLAAFWKSKYEKTCEALVRATEKLSNATHELSHLSQLNGRDPSYLEKALAALRDGEAEEQVRGDSIKQQFLLECRRRGMTPDEVQTRRFANAGTKGMGATVSKRSLKQKETGAVNEDDSIHKQLAREEGGESGGIEGGDGSGLYLLPEDVGYVESFSDLGHRVPVVRDVGLRIEALRKEIEVADTMLGYITENLDQRAFDLDDLQTRYSELAGAMVFDEDLPAVEANIRAWADVERVDQEGYYEAFAVFRAAREATKEATHRAIVVGRSELKIKAMEEELSKAKQRLDVEYAQQKLLKSIPNDAERAHVAYLDAQLVSLGAERRLLMQEMFEVERKAKGYATEVEAKLGMADFDPYYGFERKK